VLFKELIQRSPIHDKREAHEHNFRQGQALDQLPRQRLHAILREST
jgi:hypothetical protein